MRRLLLLLAVLWVGCITHIPPNAFAPKSYLTIDWSDTFEEARAQARQHNQPLLVFLVAGELDGAC